MISGTIERPLCPNCGHKLSCRLFQRDYECDLCGKNFPREELSNNTPQQAKDTGMMRCPWCDHTMDKYSIQWKSPEQCVCPRCRLDFDSEDGIKLHKYSGGVTEPKPTPPPPAPDYSKGFVLSHESLVPKEMSDLLDMCAKHLERYAEPVIFKPNEIMVDAVGDANVSILPDRCKWHKRVPIKIGGEFVTYNSYCKAHAKSSEMKAFVSWYDEKIEKAKAQAIRSILWGVREVPCCPMTDRPVSIVFHDNTAFWLCEVCGNV